ncbi:MAG: YfcE family phosphodiesterase [Phototrophicaceae bacterium]
MDTIRLGLISDTHFPTKMPLLPYEAIENAFREVDGILHAGDIESSEVLEHLSGIAPTQAVKGEHDNFALPEKRILTFGDVRVGLVHGNRHPLTESYFRLQRRLGNLYAGGRHLLNTIPERFADDNVDVIVFGHLHTPLAIERDGVLLVNPGAVYSITRDSAQWQLLNEHDPERRHMLETHIKRYNDNPHWQNPRSTIGILEIKPDKTVRSYIHELPLLAYA